MSLQKETAILDKLMSQKPNASYIALESIILFSQNKTSEWLSSKSPEEKQRLLQAARKLTKVHRNNFKKRQEEIESKRLEAMLQKERENLKKKEKDLKENDLTLKVQKYGLWTSGIQVKQQLSQIKSKEAKVDALKVQLNFRKEVLGQHHEKQIFQFSQNGRPFSVDELTENLCRLFRYRSSAR